MRPHFEPQISKVVSVGLFLLLMLLYMYNASIERYAYKPNFNEGPPWIGMRPAGEIHKDFKLKQSISVSETDLPDFDFANPVCVEILFASYGNRRNTGSFGIELITPDKSESKILEASQINDNELKSTCFETIRFQDIYKKEAWIEINGIDGLPNKSVTAVVSALPQGERADINGETTTDTLVMYLAVKKDPGLYRIISYTLLVFSALIMGLLMFATRSLAEDPASAGG